VVVAMATHRIGNTQIVVKRESDVVPIGVIDDTRYTLPELGECLRRRSQRCDKGNSGAYNFNAAREV